MDAKTVIASFSTDPYAWLCGQLQKGCADEIADCLRRSNYFEHVYLLYRDGKPHLIFCKRGYKRWRLAMIFQQEKVGNCGSLPSVINQPIATDPPFANAQNFLEDLWFTLCWNFMDAWLPTEKKYLRSLVPHIKTDLIWLADQEQQIEIRKLACCLKARLIPYEQELFGALCATLSRLLQSLTENRPMLAGHQECLIPLFAYNRSANGAGMLMLFYRKHECANRILPVRIDLKKLASSLIHYRLQSAKKIYTSSHA